MGATLDEMLNPGELPVLVLPDGTFRRAAYPPATLTEYAPETIYVDYDGPFDGASIMETHERAAIESIEGGWEILTGWSADPSLFIMRNDQRIGGDLEAHILATPGLWDVVPVDIAPHPCQEGKGGMPCGEWDARESCEHEEGGESEGVGWALVHRNRAVVLGKAMDKGRGGIWDTWPVMRDGMEFGWVIQERTGYRMLVPGELTESGESHRGPQRVSADDARKDAEEWLTENVA